MSGNDANLHAPEKTGYSQKYTAWVLKNLGVDLEDERREQSVSTSGSDRGTVFNSVPDLNGSVSDDSVSISVDSTSFSTSVDGSSDGENDEPDPSRQYVPLPQGVDLSQARLGTSIKSGAFGSVSWVDGAKGAPPLVIKVPKGGKKDELEHEAEYYAKIGEHPNIAGCLGMQRVGRSEGLVMEGIKGRDMHGVMNKLNTLSNADPQTAKKNGMDRALSHEESVGTMQYMMREMLKGLAHLEEKGVVHADIRPDNVMCDAETGAVKIVDFGLAFEADKESVKGRIAPVGHGMVPPEMSTEGATVTSKADVFAAGEIARRSMEGDQFRYGTQKSTVGWSEAREFGQKDDEGHDKQALNPMPDTELPPVDEDGDDAGADERVTDLNARLRRFEDDPLRKNNPVITDLRNRIWTLSQQLPDPDLADLEDVEQRMEIAERSLKTSGTYGAITSYTEFVNWAMNPDASKRPTAKEALAHPYLQDSLLDDEGAQAVLKKLMQPNPNENVEPLPSTDDSSTSVSDSSWSSTGSVSVDNFEEEPDEFGRITKVEDGYTVWLTEDGGWSRDPKDAKKNALGGGKVGADGLITKEDESGYTVWQTGDGGWSRNKKDAKRLGGGGGSQDSVNSVDSVDSVDSASSVDSGGELGADGLVTKTDDSGYTVWQTGEGGWSRNKKDAKQPDEQQGGGSAGSGSGGPGEEPSQTQSDAAYQDQPDFNAEQENPPPPGEQQDGKGGWTGATPGGDRKRGGPQLGGARTRQQPDTAKEPPKDNAGGWARTAPSPDAKRGGATMGGRPPQQDADAKPPPGGWTRTNPSPGAPRGNPPPGRGRGST